MKATAVTDAQILETIQQNIDIQKRNPPASKEATDARENNRALFVEAALRGLSSESIK